MNIKLLKQSLFFLICITFTCCGSSESSEEPAPKITGGTDQTPNPDIDAPTDLNTFETQSLTILNNIRSSSRRCGFRNYNATTPLTWNRALETAAQIHLEDMIKNRFFEHTGSDGSSVGDRAEKSGYSFQGIAENLAEGQRSLQETFNAWIDSPGHCQNLMGDNHREFALVTENNVWVAVFGRSF